MFKILFHVSDNGKKLSDITDYINSDIDSIEANKAIRECISNGYIVRMIFEKENGKKCSLKCILKNTVCSILDIIYLDFGYYDYLTTKYTQDIERQNILNYT